MANTKQAKKAQRQAQGRRVRNKAERGRVKTLSNAFEKAIESGDKAVMQTSARQYISSLDKAFKHNTIHRNKASRKKSLVMATVAKLKG